MDEYRTFGVKFSNSDTIYTPTVSDADFLPSSIDRCRRCYATSVWDLRVEAPNFSHIELILFFVHLNEGFRFSKLESKRIIRDVLGNNFESLNDLKELSAEVYAS